MVRLASIAAISWPNLSWEASAPWIRKLSSASLNACGSTFGPAVDGITAVAGGGAGGLAARLSTNAGAPGDGTIGLLKSSATDKLWTGRESTTGKYLPSGENRSPRSFNTEV